MTVRLEDKNSARDDAVSRDMYLWVYYYSYIRTLCLMLFIGFCLCVIQSMRVVTVFPTVLFSKLRNSHYRVYIG